MKLKTASFLALLPALTVITPVMAGGGLIYISSTPTGPIPAGQAYILTAAVQKEDYSPCTNCAIKWSVEDLHPSKYIINPESDRTDSNGNAVAKIALTQNADATISVHVNAQLPTQNYKSSSVLLYFTQTDQVNDYFPVQSNGPTPYGTPEPPVGYGQPIQATPNSNPKLDELQDKVSDLQDKLEKSQKKQNFLEAQLAAITNFLKSIFPFWK